MPDVYQRWVSPLLHSISGVSGACRFYPSCSEYAATAIAHHGFLRGSGLAVWRLLRCQPFAHGGFDPVPGTYRSTDEPVAEPAVGLHGQTEPSETA